MADLKFSVGKIVRGAVTIATVRNITVRHDGAPVEFRGSNYAYPLEIEPGDQSLIITAETGLYTTDAPTFGSRETLQLTAGNQGGGLAATFTNMILVSAEVRSTQDGFVVTALEWRKAEA